MTTIRSRILALAAVAALAMTQPAAAATTAAPEGQAPVGKAPGVTYVLDKGVTSNRLATSRMWSGLYDAVQELRADAAAEKWDAALVKVREVRTRIDALAGSKVVDHRARLLVRELRPHAVDLEERIVTGRGRGVLRGVDALIAQVGRTQNELLASGAMERMGGGAGAWRLPAMPEVKVYPPGNERNQMEEWRGPND